MLPKVLKNFNLMINGVGYAGRVQEVTLPKLAHKTEEFRLGGLDTPVQVDMGLEKLESELTLSEYDSHVIKLFGIEDESTIPIPLRGSPLGFTGFGSTNSNKIGFTLRGGLSDELNDKVIPTVVYYEGAIIELDFGQWKAGENAPLKMRLALRYYRLTIDNENLVEIDVDNRVRKINKYDQIAIKYTGRSASGR
jgi:phage tail tube protein FII